MSATTQHRVDYDAVAEDVEFLIDTRVHPAWWAARLGTTHNALLQQLRRGGRLDLAAYLYTERQRGLTS